MGRYIPLIIFTVLIIAGIVVFTYFKIKWGIADRAEKRGHEENIEKEKNEERKQQNQTWYYEMSVWFLLGRNLPLKSPFMFGFSNVKDTSV